MRGGQVRTAAFSPDGQFILTAGGGDKKARLFSAGTRKPGPVIDFLDPLGWNSPVFAVSFSPDGQTVLLGGGTTDLRRPTRNRMLPGRPGFLITLDATKGHSLKWGGSTDFAYRAIAYCPDGKSILVANDWDAQFLDARTGQPIGTPLENRGLVRAVAFSRDGAIALTAGSFWDRWMHQYANTTLYDEGELRHWDAMTGRALWKVPLFFTSLAAFSGDGKQGLGISTHSGNLVVSSVDLATGVLNPGRKDSSSAAGADMRPCPMIRGAIGFEDRSVAFSRDGGAALFGRVFRNLNVEGPSKLPGDSKIEYSGPIRAAALSPDGQVALTAGEDRTARLWSTKTGTSLVDPLVHELTVICVAFSPDGRTALTGSDDGTAKLWDVATGKRLGVPLVHQAPVRDVAFSPDGKRILTGCEDGQSRLWDLSIESRAGIPLASSGQGRILAVACSSDGELVMTGGEDGAVRLWDARTGDPLGQPWAHAKPVHAVAFSPDGNTILVGTWMQARLYDAVTAAPRGAPLIHQTGFVRTVAFSPDGKFALTGGDDCSAWLWDTTTGQPVGNPMRYKKPVSAVAYGPDGKTVAVAADTDVRVFDAPLTVPPGRRLIHTGVVRAVIYSPDGKTLLTRSGDADARLWDVATGEPRGEPLTRRGPVRAAAFDPTGNTVITGGDLGRVQLWDAASGQPLGEALEINGSVRAVAYTLSDNRFGLDGHLEIKGSIRAVGFSPDGKTTITAAEDGTARCWDTATRRPLGKPIPIPDKLASLQISARGKTLLALAQDGSVRLWNFAELPDDFARVATWIEVLTGLTTDSEGSIKPLDHDAWQRRRALLNRLGGPP